MGTRRGRPIPATGRHVLGREPVDGVALRGDLVVDELHDPAHPTSPPAVDVVRDENSHADYADRGACDVNSSSVAMRAVT